MLRSGERVAMRHKMTELMDSRREAVAVFLRGDNNVNKETNKTAPCA